MFKMLHVTKENNKGHSYLKMVQEEPIGIPTSYTRLRINAWSFIFLFFSPNNHDERIEGNVAFVRTSHPSSLKTWPPTYLLLIHLKWPRMGWFGVFKADSGVKSTTKVTSKIRAISRLLCWMKERYFVPMSPWCIDVLILVRWQYTHLHLSQTLAHLMGGLQTHGQEPLRATSHTRLRARDHNTSTTLIGGKGGAGPSSLRLRDQRSMWMQDGCKVSMDSYMASTGSCFMVTWIIFFIKKTTSWR